MGAPVRGAHAAIEVSFPTPPTGETVALDVALSRLDEPDRESAAATAGAVTEALAPGLRTRAYVFNTLLADKAIDDRLRRYPALAVGPQPRQRGQRRVGRTRSSRRSAARYEIAAHAGTALKARLLGVERLADYDRMAAVDAGRGAPSVRRRRASSCSTATRRFSPELGRRRAGDSSRATGSTRPCGPGSAAGAFCAVSGAVGAPVRAAQLHARRRDVLTLAHELGHGVHFALAGRRACSTSDAAHARGDGVGVRRDDRVRPAARPRTSVAGLASGAARREPRGHDRDRVPPDRDEPLRGARAHRPRASEGELSVERFGELWTREPGRDVRRRRRGHRGLPPWWSYIPHFIGTPGLRVRLRLRPAARAVGVRALRAAPAGVRAAVPRDARRRRLAQPPRSSARSSTSTSPTPASGTRAWTSSQRQLEQAEAAAQASGRDSAAARGSA